MKKLTIIILVAVLIVLLVTGFVMIKRSHAPKGTSGTSGNPSNNNNNNNNNQVVDSPDAPIASTDSAAVQTATDDIKTDDFSPSNLDDLA